MRVQLPRVPPSPARAVIPRERFWVRSATGKRTRFLIEVVRVRLPPDPQLRLATSVARRGPLRDRLAGRTLVSESRNTGSTPVPGTKASHDLVRRPRSLKTWRTKARPRTRSTLLYAARRADFSSEAEWSGSRLLSGHLGGSIPPAGALAHSVEALHASRIDWFDSQKRLLHSSETLRSTQRSRRVLPARVNRVRSCPCFSMVEQPPRTRLDPVRFRAWALVSSNPNRPYTQNMLVRLQPPSRASSNGKTPHSECGIRRFPHSGRNVI